MSKPAPERCPLCRKPSIDPHRPFCSAVCRDRDLISWLDERYSLPGRPESIDDQDDRSQ